MSQNTCGNCHHGRVNPIATYQIKCYRYPQTTTKGVSDFCGEFSPKAELGIDLNDGCTNDFSIFNKG